MAHEIDQSTGNAAIFTVGEPAWHKLGVTVEQAQNSAEAIKLAGLDWEIEQWPVRAFNPDTGEEAGCPGKVANVRTDTKRTLAVVSPTYQVFQNRDSFDFFDAIVGDKLAMYETAGSLRDGKRIWILARVPREYRAAKDDLVRPYILLVNGHDGHCGLRMFATTVRVVCMNTLNLAINANGTQESLSMGHWGNLESRVADARRKLGLITERFDVFSEEMKALVRVKMSVQRVKSYFDRLLPKKDAENQRQAKTRDLILEHFHTNFGNDRNNVPGIKGTAWAAFNAVTEFADHQRKFIGKTDGQKVDNQLNNIWFGDSHRLKQRAYGLAMALVK